MKRYMFRMRVQAGHEQEYIRRHEMVWPTVLQACKEAGIQNYSIFMDGTDLVAYLECQDFAAASHILAANPEAMRWAAYMSPIATMVTDESGSGTHFLREVFHLE